MLPDEVARSGQVAQEGWHPKEERESKASKKERVPRLAGSSGRTAREEEKARSLEREAVHLLARRTSPRKLRKRRLRTMHC